MSPHGFNATGHAQDQAHQHFITNVWGAPGPQHLAEALGADGCFGEGRSFFQKYALIFFVTLFKFKYRDKNLRKSGYKIANISLVLLWNTEGTQTQIYALYLYTLYFYITTIIKVSFLPKIIFIHT